MEPSDLRQTTPGLMAQMEADLCKKLDWIAVDHHNTGHPDTHILLRGVTECGKMLNIAGDCIAHGIRERASEIVTLELSRQTEQDVSLRLCSVFARARLSRSALYRKIAKGTRPTQLRISIDGVGWRESDIDQWVRDLVGWWPQGEPLRTAAERSVAHGT